MGSSKKIRSMSCKNSLATCTRLFCPPERSNAEVFKHTFETEEFYEFVASPVPRLLGHSPEEPVEIEIFFYVGKFKRDLLLDDPDALSNFLPVLRDIPP